MNYPQDAVSRREKRNRIEQMKLAEAQREALIAGRSMKCAGTSGQGRPVHADELGGCANDGTNCICECHDPAPVASNPAEGDQS